MTIDARGSRLGRRAWIVISNSLLCVEAAYTCWSSISFDRSLGRELAPYGAPLLPLGIAILQVLRHNIPLLLVAILLAWGAVAESRRWQAAAMVNPVAYLLVGILIIWDFSSVPHDEHFIPILISEGPNLIVAIVNLVLYRKAFGALARSVVGRHTAGIH